MSYKVSKPVKGVIPAKKPVDTVKSETKENNTVQSTGKSFTPVQRRKPNSSLTPVTKAAQTIEKAKEVTKPNTKTIKIPQSEEEKVHKIPDQAELDYIVEAISEKMLELFVTKKELKEEVTKVLQEMVVENSNVSSK